MENALCFEQNTFKKRVKSMLKVDFSRMIKSRLFYIIVACALAVPVVMAVMLTMMDGSVSVDPQTGKETVMDGPDYVWELIGDFPSEGDNTEASAGAGAGGMAAGGMDVLGMCNINLAFMGVAVFVCLFISDDFKSGYAKNLFTVRAKKWDYIISKTLAGFTCGGAMLLAYLLGTLIGGAITQLSFDLGVISVGNVVMCMLAKIFLMLVFVAIFTLISVAAKQRTWLSVCGSLGGGMIMFMMIPMLTPLTSTVMHVGMCLAGGLLFSLGLGAIGTLILKKTRLV